MLPVTLLLLAKNATRWNFGDNSKGEQQQLHFISLFIREETEYSRLARPRNLDSLKLIKNKFD